MKITVNLDTQAVITQPSPLRFKAGCFNPVEIGFTRSSQSASLPDGAVIEFALKPKNQWTGGLLAYLNVLTLVPGNLYTGSLNCATTALLSALGISDQTPFNDLAQLDASAEVTWSFSDQKFRSNTFSVTVETPLTDDIAVATPDPELYPTPAEVARKSDLPEVATWNHHPTSYGYQWRRNGTAIAGATGSTYTVASGDLAATISCAVTATNLAGTSGAVTTAESSAVIPIRSVLADSSLLGFWKFDETSGSRIDISDNGRNLTPSETITTVPGPFGGSCAAFRRTGYLQNSALTPTFTGTTITASLWVRLLTLEEGSFMTQWSGGGWLNLGSSPSGLRFGFGHDCLDRIIVPVSTGTWHHVTQSWDGNQIRVTVDGSEYTLNKANMPENPPRLTNANAPFDIGCSDTWNGSSRANADICCVGLWKRALSAAETTALYNNGAGLIYPF